ncbi:MAG: hypothetical protein HZB43_04950 [candidate division Zixibacteria bacterium]|nr:hypothetical protein [candidate division Zixibacteria bacterium]
MKRFYIWGMVAWAIGWLFLWPNPDISNSTFLWLAGIGTFLILIAGWGESAAPMSNRWPWRAIVPGTALAVFWWWFGDVSYNGIVVIAAATAVLVIAGRYRIGRFVGNGLIVAGTIGALQLVGLYIYFVYLGPRGHGTAIPTSILASAFSLFGIKATALADGLRLLATDRIYHAVPTANNMGLPVFIQMVMGLVALALTGKIKVRSIFIGGFLITGFAFLRYAVILLWDYNQGGMVDTFWSQTILAWTVWPIGLFLHHLAQRVSPVTTPATAISAHPTPGPLFPRRLLVAVVATALGMYLWTAFEGYHPAGERKAGRMLIDELHSDWEWTEMPFDTIWYGQQSTYNFYSLAEFWKNFYSVDRGHDTLTPALLAKYDILVLKVPTSPYSPKEIEAVHDWVNDGGGLLIVGEHTNVFGYATFLNPVIAKFGVRYTADIVYELKTGDLNLHRKSELLPHPIAQNMPIDFLFGGPCSMWEDLSARSIITERMIKTLPADYTQRNFFPERNIQTSYRYGLFSLAMSTRYGKGHIVGFGDSTIWSNFFVFISGKWELALGLAEYANRKESFQYWRILAFLFGAGLLLVGAVAAAGLKLEGWVWFAAVACLTFGGSARLFESINRKNFPLPTPHTAFAQLNFEREHSQFFLPELRLAREPDKDFSTFYLWTQRVGVVPLRFPTLEEALAQPGALMIIDPGTPFDQNELKRLKDFVERGSTLYIFDDPLNRMTTSAPLMEQFGMSFDLRPVSLPAAGAVDLSPTLWQSGGRVIGGEPILALPDGTASCAIKRIGAGQVIAFANSHIFERKTMGYTAMIPNPIQNTISQFEYRLMRYLNYPPKSASADSTAATTEKRD